VFIYPICLEVLEWSEKDFSRGEILFESHLKIIISLQLLDCLEKTIQLIVLASIPQNFPILHVIAYLKPSFWWVNFLYQSIVLSSVGQ